MKKKLNVLIVDDDPNILLLLRTRMLACGYDVLLARDGLEALDLLRRSTPDLILLDNLMPRMTGYNLIQTLQKDSNEALRDIPIIVMSAKHNMKSIIEETGHRFMQKPIESEKLMQMIGQIFGFEEAELDDDHHTQKKVILMGLEPFIVKKLEDFLKGLGFTILKASSEAEAVELALKHFPDCLLCQYWEDEEKMNAPQLVKDVQGHKMTSEIPVLVYATEALSIDAIKVIPRQLVIPYRESKDLCDGLLEKLSEVNIVSDGQRS